MGYGVWEGSILEASLQHWLHRSQAFLGSGEMGRLHASKGFASLYTHTIYYAKTLVRRLGRVARVLYNLLCKFYNPTSYNFPQRYV